MDFDKKISLFLIILLIAAISLTVYIIVNPNPGEKFTELYILGADNKAGDYPTDLKLGETGNATVGIINHEQSTITYTMIVKLNNKQIENENITLSNGEKKEIPFSFKATQIGKNQKLEFLLYKLPDNINVYRSVYLNVNVI
ncbi:MAG: DUF1616 domain-containing protein [Methanobacterium sp.]